MTATSSTELDRATFEAGVQRHRRELHVHCYRMLGSFQESEDLVQETFLRAWRRRDTFEARSSLRAWLYRIATNACLDALDKRPRAATATGEVLWLQPYPDALLDELADERGGPASAAVAKETIEIAFLVAIQRLPALQRAVLILRDVLDLPARDTAAMLDTTVHAVNSALQRAHAAMREHLPEPRAEWPGSADASVAERELVHRYVEYSERADVDALAQLLTDDVRFSMPPEPGVWEGRDAVVQCWVDGGFGQDTFGSMRCVVTRANHQPALACYVRAPGGEHYAPLAVEVLRIAEGRVSEIVIFDSSVFESFGLPAAL
jgi:RNA polymerase sigma-70 factor (ECF subfamily)